MPFLQQTQRHVIPMLMTAAAAVITVAGTICIYRYYSHQQETEEKEERSDHNKIGLSSSSSSSTTSHSSSEAMISAVDFNTIVAKTGRVHSIQNLFQDFTTAATVLKMAKYARVFTSKHLEKLLLLSDLDEFYEELDRGMY